MNSTEIAALACKLGYGPSERAIELARLTAECCARVAEQTPGSAADAIRAAFDLRVVPLEGFAARQTNEKKRPSDLPHERTE